MTYKWIPQGHLRFFQIFLLCVAVGWGIDYLITPPWAIGTALSVIERAFPLWVWGVFFITAGCLGLLGELWMEHCRHVDQMRFLGYTRRKEDQCCLKQRICLTREDMRGWPSYLAHSGLLALYAALGLGYAINLVVEWHFWGLRAPMLMWAFAAAHWIYMQRRRSVGIPV